MSAVRPNRAIKPTILAHEYRLGRTAHREPIKTVKRCSKDFTDGLDSSLGNDALSEASISIERSLVDEELDPDEEDAYYFDTTSPRLETDNRDPVLKTYEAACKKMGLLEMTAVKSNLLKQSFSCKFTQLPKYDLKAVCYSLVESMHVESIGLEQNGLDPESFCYIGKVVSSGVYLTSISIVDNNLRSAGAKIICDALLKNKSVTYVNLSGNDFVESDGTIFKKLLDHSNSVSELYLGRNKLMDFGVQEIANGVEDSAVLRVLDLQWNHIRLEGAKAIGEALKDNASLEVVNLAWNGLHMDGACAIAQALKKNESLKELDLTCNRMTEECIGQILLGLDKNNTLEVLKLGQNHITHNGAEVILKHIANNNTSGLKFLDLGNQEVRDTFCQIYKQIQKERFFHVTHGMVWDSTRKPQMSAYLDDDETMLLKCNPLTVLMECMRLQNLRLIDFFMSLDVNKSNMVCINELCTGMLKLGVPIKRLVLLRLLQKLDKDKNGQLDFAEMTQAQNLHRLTIRKALQAENLDDTEIGRTSALLRKVMAKNFIMKKQDSAQNELRPQKPSRTPSPFYIDDVETGMSIQSSVSRKSPNVDTPATRTSRRNSGSTRSSSASSVSSKKSSKIIKPIQNSHKAKKRN